MNEWIMKYKQMHECAEVGQHGASQDGEAECGKMRPKSAET